MNVNNEAVKYPKERLIEAFQNLIEQLKTIPDKTDFIRLKGIGVYSIFDEDKFSPSFIVHPQTYEECSINGDLNLINWDYGEEVENQVSKENPSFISIDIMP